MSYPNSTPRHDNAQRPSGRAAQSQTLYFCEGRSDKVYTVTLLDGTVSVAWGRRGATMQTKTFGPLPADEATRLYDAKLKEKLATGYTPGASATPLETTAPSTGPSYTIPQPMLLNEVGDRELLARAPDPNWVFQEKYDGNRILLVKRGGDLTSYSRTGRETRALPKPIVAAALACPEDFILDGEIVDDTIWAFDLLRGVEGDISELPYHRRIVYLGLLFGHSRAGIRVVETAEKPESKFALFAAVRERGGEGIVLKNANAAYSPGRPNSGGPALKYKFVASASVIVASHNVKRSVNMKLADGTAIGSVTIPPNRAIPEIGLVIEVRYLYAHRGGALCQPVYLATRTDVAPSECTAEQLKYKGGLQ